MDVFMQAFVYGLTLAALYLPIAIGLNLVFGVLRILNFAHGDLYMLGAMFTWYFLTTLGVGFFPALILGVVVCAALGIVIERVLLRPMGAQILPALIISMGLGLVLQTSTLLIAGSDVKHYAFPLQGTVRFLSTRLSSERLAISLCGFIGVTLFYLVLQRTKLGREIRAVAQDVEAATYQGINPSRIKIISMALGTALAAMGGGLAATIFGVEPFMGSGPLIFSFVVIVLGGLGSIEGAFIAGLALGIAESFVTIYVGATEAAMAMFVVLYLMLLFRPNGLMGRRRLTGGYI